MSVRQEVTTFYVCDRCSAESESKGALHSDMHLLAWKSSPAVLPTPEEVNMWLCQKCTIELRSWIRTGMGLRP